MVLPCAVGVSRLVLDVSNRITFPCCLGPYDCLCLCFTFYVSLSLSLSPSQFPPFLFDFLFSSLSSSPHMRIISKLRCLVTTRPLIGKHRDNRKKKLLHWHYVHETRCARLMVYWKKINTSSFHLELLFIGECTKLGERSGGCGSEQMERTE